MDAIDEIEALKKELQFYKTRSDLAIERSNDGFWDWDIVEGTLYNSSRWFEIVGWREKSLPKGMERFVKIVYPEDLERVEKTLNEYLQGKIEHYRIEFSIICEDGSVRYLLDRGSAVFNEDAKPLRMAGFCTDITDDKLKDIMLLRQNKMELEKAHKNLAAIFQIIPGQLFVKDKQMRYIEVNDTFLSMLGKSREEIIGKNIEEVFSHSPRLIRQYEQADQDIIREKQQHYESKLQLANAKRMDVLVDKRIITDERGNFNGIVGLVTDITKIKESETRLEKALFKADQANRIKTQFLANMSHEIRTPMNAIIGFSELLQQSGLNAQQHQYVSTIMGSSKTLLTLINDILDLSKIEAGKINLNYNIVDFVAIFEDLVKIFLPEAEEKNIKLELNIQENFPLGIYFDEVRLHQIFLNIIGNAIKFTDEGFVKIDISFSFVRAKTIELEVKVIDSGIGIKKIQQSRIFNLFEQQDEQDTRKYGGTGLGLSISQNLAQVMGGDIRVESEEAKGSTFIVSFENVGIETDMEDVILEIPHVRFKKALLLVVDDVKTNAELIKSLFIKSSIEVISAKNGQEAYDISKEKHPDLILMDIRMPIMDGYESTCLIKKNPDTKSIPIIALTASVVFKNQEYYLEKGFDGFLQKPLETKALLGYLKKYLTYDIMEDTVSSTEIVLSDMALKKLKAFISVLEAKYNEDYKEILNQNSFEAYALWAQKLLEYSYEYDNNYMVSYATQILDAIEAFDIEKFRAQMQGFPNVIKELKKRL